MNNYLPCLYHTVIDNHAWPSLSEHNLIVGVEPNSVQEQEVFREALRSLYNTTNDILIVCPNSMVNQIQAMVQDYINTYKPVMLTTLQPPDEFPAYHPRFEWYSNGSTLRITTPQRLFDNLYPSKDRLASDDLGWVPSGMSILAIGLDRCTSILEQGMFELVLSVARRGASRWSRQILLFDRSIDLHPIAKRANADVIRFDDSLVTKHLKSALPNEDVATSILSRVVEADNRLSLTIRLQYEQAAVHLFDSFIPLEILCRLTDR